MLVRYVPMEASLQVQKFLEAWHTTVENKNVRIMEKWIANDVKLFSPALYRAKEGREVVIALLVDVLGSFETYTVTKTWIDGNEILLEFDAKVNGRLIQGVDKITLNSEGQMAQLKVFIRPFTGLKALISSVVQMQIERMSGIPKILAKIQFAIKSRG